MTFRAADEQRVDAAAGTPGQLDRAGGASLVSVALDAVTTPSLAESAGRRPAGLPV